MTDYSFVPQMYQQGVQQGLDKQFQLANRAQPVAQFLQALRQGKQDELQQQMEADRQRRLDIQEAQQEAMNRRYMAQSDIGIAKEASQLMDGTPEGYTAAKAMADRAGAGDILPDTSIVSAPVGRSDYGPDQGTVTLDGAEIPLTPQSGPKSFTDIIKYPKGAAFMQKEATEAGKNARAAASRESKQMIAGVTAELKRAKDAHAVEMDITKKKKLEAEIERLNDINLRADKLDMLGEPEAVVELLKGRTAQTYAIAGSAASQVPLNVARAGLAGAQTALTETKTENADMTDSDKAAAVAARAGNKKKVGLSFGKKPDEAPAAASSGPKKGDATKLPEGRNLSKDGKRWVEVRNGKIANFGVV